jgi:SM-20-related protein
MSENLLNLELLQATPIVEQPFPYLTLSNFINTSYLSELVDSFPAINHRGSFPAQSVQCQPLFKRLIQQLEGEPLREMIAEKFKINLSQKPTMLTLRGQVTERDGHIHTDSKDKLITLLLYMNLDWDSDTGKLRLLNSHDSLDNYVEEISPHAGSCLIFKVTDNCWHGHKIFTGKRLSLQLNYLNGKAALTKHLNHHKLTGFIKKCLKSAKAYF